VAGSWARRSKVMRGEAGSEVAAERKKNVMLSAAEASRVQQ
jgi:hypothetical protein